MPQGPDERPCFGSEKTCEDCDGTPQNCSVNFCADMGIPPDLVPKVGEVDKVHFDHVQAMSEWLRQQYGCTSKSELIQQISEITLTNKKLTRNEYRAFLTESAWQMAHLEFIIQRMSEDFADLSILAEQMGDALMSVQMTARTEVTNALAEWTAFREWLYDDNDDNDEEED